QSGARRRARGTLERGPAPSVVDRGAEAIELIGRRAMQPGRDEQPVERELHVVAARAAVADGRADVLLERRAHVEARVVVRAEEARLAEPRQPGDELPGRLEQACVVARAVRPEPVAFVVRLELAQELERLRWPHGCERTRPDQSLVLGAPPE